MPMQAMNTVPITERWLVKSDDDLLYDLVQATFRFLYDQGCYARDGQRTAATVRSLPQGLRALLLATIVESEVHNGGFTQYLSNRNAINIDEAISDLKWLGAAKRAEIVAQIREMIVELRKEHPVLIAVEAEKELNDNERSLLNDCWDAFEQRYEATFDSLATEYYRVAGEEPLFDALLERMRARPAEFMIPAEMA
jgi:pullulanase/glycogen debranching enzyme